ALPIYRNVVGLWLQHLGARPFDPGRQVLGHDTEREHVLGDLGRAVGQFRGGHTVGQPDLFADRAQVVVRKSPVHTDHPRAATPGRQQYHGVAAVVLTAPAHVTDRSHRPLGPAVG